MPGAEQLPKAGDEVPPVPHFPASRLKVVTESLDYEPWQSAALQAAARQQQGTRHFYGYTGHTLAKFCVTLATGLLTGLVAVVIANAVEYAVLGRAAAIQALVQAHPQTGFARAFAFHAGLSVALTLLAACLVQFWAPGAAGGGVSLVMAFLNGNDIPELLRARTLVAKTLGITAGVAANLAVGPEAPLVHLGACVASLVAHWESGTVVRSIQQVCTRALRRLGLGGKGASADEARGPHGLLHQPYYTDADNREFVSAGAAAGLAAAFGAPIGGVLFSMEEACSHWSRKVAWRCFLAAVSAAFVLFQLHPRAQSGILSFQHSQVMSNGDWMRQLPLVVALSLAGGLLGAAFNLARTWLWRLRASRARPALRLLEVAAWTLVTVVAIFAAIYSVGHCIKKPDSWGAEYGIALTCPEGQYNDVATLFLSAPTATVQRIFSLSVAKRDDYDACSATNACAFTAASLAVMSAVYLPLMAAASGLAVPGGLFMPAIILGSSFGAAAGLMLMKWLPAGWNIQPGMYAIVAGTATLGGVFRSAISLVVIVVEGTRGIDYMFGIIIAVVCSNWIAQHIHRDGVYESELERDGTVAFLRNEPAHALRLQTAADVMSRGVQTLPPIAPVSRVLQLLRNSTHNGFPVCVPVRTTQLPSDEPESSGEDDGSPPGRRAGGAGGGVGQQLEGFILRSQLLVLLRARAFCDGQGAALAPGARPPEEVQADVVAQMGAVYRVNLLHRRSLLSRSSALEALEASVAQTCSQMAASDGAAQAAERVASGQLATLPLPAVPPPGSALERVYLDLRPFMHCAPLTIRQEANAARAHQLFVTLGLRHLCVTDARNCVAGIITRKDLDRAAGRGWWRVTRMSPLPPRRFANTVRSLLSLTGHWWAVGGSEQGPHSARADSDGSPRAPLLRAEDRALAAVEEGDVAGTNSS